MSIESDRMGADGRLAIKFYKYSDEDKAATIAEGRPIFREVDYIKIVVPGDSLSEIDRPVYESDKTRFPIQWANYLNRQNDDGKYEGTPLKEWNLISRSQAESLRAMRFYTVEQVAMASDQQIQSIGMAAGMSPYAFRDKAKAFIDSAKTEADFTKRAEEIEQLRLENERIQAEAKEEMAKLRAQLDSVVSMLPKAKAKKQEIQTNEVE